MYQRQAYGGVYCEQCGTRAIASNSRIAVTYYRPQCECKRDAKLIKVARQFIGTINVDPKQKPEWANASGKPS
jgi:hypothetical protein